MKLCCCLAALLVIVACGTRGGASLATPPAASAAPATSGQSGDDAMAPECERVLACYDAMAGELCRAGEDKCLATFRITAPTDKPETCERLRDQAKETAKPFIGRRRYRMPAECT